MRLTRYEQETIILMNAGDKEATVYTADRAVMRKLDALVKMHPESYRIVSEDAISKSYSMPKHSSVTVDREPYRKKSDSRPGI